jgi:hypothetical protein
MERNVARVIAWNRFWLAVLVVIGLGWWADRTLQQVRERQAPRVWWERDTVVIGSGNDGPYVVTHLAVKPAGEGFREVAALPSPVGIVESGRTVLGAEQVAALEWKDAAGRTVAAPAAGTPLRALYLRGGWSRGAE